MLKNLFAITLIIMAVIKTEANETKEYKFIMQEYEPFNWTDGNTLKGGMLEVAKAVCFKMKISCRFESLPMKRVISMLEDGSTTGVLSLAENSDRAKFASLSTPIIDSKMSYFAIKGNYGKVKSLSDLAGSTVGTVASSSAEKMANTHKSQIGKLDVISETGLPILFNKLVAGRYGVKGVAFTNRDVFSLLLKKQNIKNVEVIFTAHTEQFRIAFSKKATTPEFTEKFNFEILKMKKSGELKRILKPFNLKPS